MAAPSPQQLRDLALDLAVEERKLDALVDSLAALGDVAGDRLRIDAAALRLQSFYTGIERCFLQVSRVLNGGTPDGQDWQRRLLERMGQPTEERPAVLAEASIAYCRSCFASATWCGICMPMNSNQSRWSGCAPLPSPSGRRCGASWTPSKSGLQAPGIDQQGSTGSCHSEGLPR